MQVIEMSRQIMDNLSAFRGSKPVVHNSEAMLIKGISREKVEIDQRDQRLHELFKTFDIKNVDVDSKESNMLVEKIDQVFRNTTDVFDQSNGILGIEKLKHTFEITGFAINYMIGKKDDMAIFIAMWSDKSGAGPMFVESMVVNIKSADQKQEQ